MIPINKTKQLAIIALIILIGCAGYYFRGVIHGPYFYVAEKTVDNALKYLKNSRSLEGIDGYSLFSSDYNFIISRDHSYYEFDTWKCNCIASINGKYKIQVVGLATNDLKEKSERSAIFVVEKQENKWVITDSYGFTIVKNVKNDTEKSDMEKHKILDGLYEKLEIRSFTINPINNSSNLMGNATIVNNSDETISDIKLYISYQDVSEKSLKEEIINCMNGEDLRPGDSKTVVWYSDCPNYNNASCGLRLHDKYY